MVNFWSQSNAAQRVVVVILILGVLGVLGSFVWEYPSAPFSLVVGACALLNVVLGIPARSNPQENDPTRR